MRRVWILAFSLAGVLVLPFALRKTPPAVSGASGRLVILSPHNETIRREFTRGFRRWREGRGEPPCALDWRSVGGTSEIIMYVNSAYKNAFRRHWEKDLGREWSLEIQEGFSSPRVDPPADPRGDTPVTAARRAFLASDTGIGADVFFGGGSYEHEQQARQGHLVSCGIHKRHPEWFSPENDPERGIPREYRGETYWDQQGRWTGAVLSGFGIIYNVEALSRLGIEKEPRQWRDLTDPRYYGQIGAADPSKSGSIAKVFEMILQQEIQRKVRAVPENVSSRRTEEAVRKGWLEGLEVIQKIAANARYFTDSASQPNIDVSLGDCAAGMSIDFYGRYQEETVRRRGGSNRFRYVTPAGGSSYSADPISLFRGAKNKEAAMDFIEFALSEEGQKLWCYRTKEEAPECGGPDRFALRRLPVRPGLYGEEHQRCLSDPNVNPYAENETFVYHVEWTGPLFNAIRFIIKTGFIDAHDELREAWKALCEHDFPPAAAASFKDLSMVDYDQALTAIRGALNSKNKIDELRLVRKLSRHFREQYKMTVYLAETGR